MKKCLIFITLLFSLVAQAKADGNPYSMDHSTYSHLTDEQKRMLVIKTMQLMVDLEAQYKKEYAATGHSSELYNKYVQVVYKLQQFIISDATAADSETIKALAEKFAPLLKQLGKQGCLYGGYVSKMSRDGTKCLHPGLILGSDEIAKSIRAAYLKVPAGNTCTDQGQITCNPVVFGFSKPGGPAPFCVKTGSTPAGNAAHNVSYDCMKLALSADKKDERMKDIADGMTASPAAFKEVQKLIFDTCACNESSMNAHYVEYMRPHRTCFGMLNTIRSVNNSECSVLDKVDTADFADQWNKYFGGKAFDQLKPEYNGDFDKKYKELMGSQALQAICKRKEQSSNETWVCEIGDCKVSGGGTGDKGKTWSCTVKTAQIQTTKEGSTQVIKTDVKLQSKTVVVDKPGKSEVAVTLADSTTRMCPVEIPEDKPEDKPACTLTVAEDEKDPEHVTVAISFQNVKEGVKPEVTWPSGKPAEDKMSVVIAKEKEEKDFEASFTIPGTGQAVQGKSEDGKISCTVKIPGKTDEPAKTYTIDATSQAPASADAPTIKVVAVVKDSEGKDVTDLGDMQIKWTRKGFDGGGNKEKKDDKPSSRIGEINTDGSENKEEGHEKKEKKGKKEKNDKEDKEEVQPEDKDQGTGETENKVGKDFDTDEPRIQKVYDSCATLLDKDNKALASDCDKVDPLEKKTDQRQPQQQYQNNGPVTPPPVFMNPANNTRAFGIQ